MKRCVSSGQGRENIVNEVVSCYAVGRDSSLIFRRILSGEPSLLHTAPSHQHRHFHHPPPPSLDFIHNYSREIGEHPTNVRATHIVTYFLCVQILTLILSQFTRPCFSTRTFRPRSSFPNKRGKICHVPCVSTCQEQMSL